MRTTTLALLVLITATGAGCNKPSESECRTAIANMRRLLDTDKLINANDIESAVRRCRGSSNKKSVTCATVAKSREELDACGLLPPPKPSKDEPAPAPPAPPAANDDKAPAK